MFSVSRFSRPVHGITNTISKRLKCYVVGVDGSKFGFAALKTALNESIDKDQIHCIHVPEDMEMFGRDQRDMFIPQTMDSIREKMVNIQSKITNEIENKCNEYKEEYAKDKKIEFNVIIKADENRAGPKDEIIQCCYDVKADCLVIGSKGISHGIKEKLRELMHRLGSVSDYCSHHAPCDVMIVKAVHEY